LGTLLSNGLRPRSKKKIDDARQNTLAQMLGDQSFQWRNLSTLAVVIGCDEDQTKNHIIAIGARGSEKNDSKRGLISRHPLSEIRRNDA
jgi:hypothetical protein